MPRADGSFAGISLGGKAAEAWERIFGEGCACGCGGRDTLHCLGPAAPADWCDGCGPGNCPGPDDICRAYNGSLEPDGSGPFGF